jgi:hypothetical protein
MTWNFHTLRHTFASWAIQRGVSLEELQELGGWSSVNMVMRYAHLAPEHLRTAVARLEGLTSSTSDVESASSRAHARAHEPANEVASLATS